ncbi:MAG: hypothetical protein NT172_11700 [Planctomycetota bacterium]|nr:hypothetical protein [Planctomycetota bacterium]
MPGLHLGRFDIDATVPMGHPLCGGWIKPATVVDDPLKLRGVIIQGNDAPIVLAAIDWTGICNQAYFQIRDGLATAAQTTPDRVSLHSVHQHDAPFCEPYANTLLKKYNSSVLTYDEVFFADLIKRAQVAVRAAANDGKPVDQVGLGQGRVHEVASARRVIGPDGKIQFSRTSATRNAKAREAPEGVVDPILKSVTFSSAGKPLARLYFYATHPMSYYANGGVSSDFVGLARQKRDDDEPGVLHVYFTGCAGNVTAGKYNDGSHQNRPILAGRMHLGMVEADRDADSRLESIHTIGWRTRPHGFKPSEDFDYDKLEATVADPKNTTTTRNRNAMFCGWLKRLQSPSPILLGRLDINKGSVITLPAETFVEYQLGAQELRPGSFLACAAYGDGGPWYIPLARSHAEGGYEPGVSLVSKQSEPVYRKAIADLIANRS